MKLFFRKIGAVFFAALFLISCLSIGASAEVTEPACEAFGETDSAPLLQGEIRFRLPELLFPHKQRREEPLKPDKSVVMLCPGGTTFGVRLHTEGVLIVGMAKKQEERAGYAGGLRTGDLILEIDGTPVEGVRSVTNTVAESGGKPISFRIRRNGELLDFLVTPVKSSDGEGYLVGILVRDSAAGIGTVTFFNPETGAFGGLGHGICDGESGNLIPVKRGSVMRVLLDGVERGRVGEPGELRGSFSPEKMGTLLANTDCGVFGVIAPVPVTTEAIPAATAEEVHAGEAKLRCSLDNGEPKDYTVEISDIRYEAKNAKCFSVHVTDPELLLAAGGIVQGMSGSPIIQDGRLIGAVTHVMINDPTRGYGIFIGNMLASMPETVR